MARVVCASLPQSGFAESKPLGTVTCLQFKPPKPYQWLDVEKRTYLND